MSLHALTLFVGRQELREKAGGGVTTDGRVFVETRAELNRLEALRRVMAERSYRMLVKGSSPYRRGWNYASTASTTVCLFLSNSCL